MEKHILSLLDILRYGGGSRGSRSNVIEQLKKADQASLVKIARGLLKDTDSKKRRLGIESLMLTDRENYTDLILPLLKDADPEIRRLAIFYLTRTEKFPKSKEMISLIIKALLEDPSSDVRVEAARALGDCRTPEAKSALLWARDHDFEMDFQGYDVSGTAEDALERLAPGNK